MQNLKILLCVDAYICNTRRMNTKFRLATTTTAFRGQYEENGDCEDTGRILFLKLGVRNIAIYFTVL